MKETCCDKREAILKAAIELIAEHGFHGAPTAMIAEKAGVGTGTIYRYFESKDDLIHALYKDFETKIKGLILSGYDKSQPIRVRFIHLGTGLLRYFINNPNEFRFLEQFIYSPYGIACRRDKIFGNNNCNCEPDLFKELFNEGIAQQVIRDMPIVILFSLFFGPIMSVSRDHILGFIELDDVLTTWIIESCWNAVKL